MIIKYEGLFIPRNYEEIKTLLNSQIPDPLDEYDEPFFDQLIETLLILQNHIDIENLTTYLELYLQLLLMRVDILHDHADD